MFRISEWIFEHRSASLAILITLIVLAFTAFNPDWWGERAVGVWIGVVGLAILFPAIVYLVEKGGGDIDVVAPWALLIIPIAIALIVRRTAGYRFVWPIRFQLPAVPRPESVIMLLTAFFILMLVIVFVRALHRGESVAVESHWGGLGGGMGGFRLSTPFIYLLGILFLLLVSSALAWNVLVPPPAQQESSVATPPSSSSPAATASPAAATSPASATNTPNP